MNFLLSLQKKWFRRFMDGRPGPWGALTVGMFGIRTLWRWSRRTEKVAYRAALEPGESVLITHTGDTAVTVKKDRRKAKKAARRSRRRPASGGDDS